MDFFGRSIFFCLGEIDVGILEVKLAQFLGQVFFLNVNSTASEGSANSKRSGIENSCETSGSRESDPRLEFG